MSASTSTSKGFPIFAGSDKPTIMGDWQTFVGLLNTLISAIDTSIASLNGVPTSLGNLQSTVTTLQGAISDLQTAVNTIDSTDTTQAGQITGLINKIGTDTLATVSSTINAAINEVRTGGTTNAADINTVRSFLKAITAADYNPNNTYPTVGTYCLNNNLLYKSNIVIGTAEAWTAAHWTQTTLTAEIMALNTIGTYTFLISNMAMDYNWKAYNFSVAISGNPKYIGFSVTTPDKSANEQKFDVIVPYNSYVTSTTSNQITVITDYTNPIDANALYVSWNGTTSIYVYLGTNLYSNLRLCVGLIY